ncbi:hypothetical protein HD553DRAFT_327634 [Filobasidium floriforme]|uniref:uncharacterized protein n=1 Tax=Filobasidium floriforme TaxID=5210 RepID=UPI001E8CD47F|nr:uncharacterized protein HD553DRAFT_327634 [Filobasidium floriforme]KAH8090957.1 hypothetical protein HD553DRAFT_327634 [Filobasidium floriforme]
MSAGYTEEERQAAYYAAQAAGPSATPTYYGSAGYAPAAGPSTSSSTYVPNHNNAYDPEMAQQSLAYNYKPDQASSSAGPSGAGLPGAGAGAGAGAGLGAGAGAATDPATQGYMGPDGKWVHPPKPTKKAAQGKRETVIRSKGGRVWEDQTLLEWDPSWFRLFVGDLSNDVNDNTLNNAFAKYPSYCKCKVVRDRLSMKARYGFIAFSDPEDYLKAWKEMDGKYVGNRPIRLMKCTDKFGGTKAVQIGARRGKELDKIQKNKGKPLDGRPVPW